MLKIKSFVFNPFEENTYVLYDESKECVIIDPGCFDTAEKLELTDFIATAGLKPVKLLNTHCHIDHVLGNAYCKRTFGIELYAHQKEEPVLLAVKAYASNYGFGGYEESEIDHYLEEPNRVTFGDTELDILFVPGHAPGHVAFYHKKSQRLIGGDVLFRQSIGRTDLPGGDYNTLIRSIHDKLFTLDDAVEVFPGHGPATSIGYEKMYNPFCGLNK